MKTPLGRKLIDAYADWGVERIEGMFGRAALEPTDAVPAGRYGTWRITFRPGRYGVTRQGRVAVAMKAVSNWGQLQLDDPAKPHYVSVHCSNPAAKVQAVFEPLSSIWAWHHAVHAIVTMAKPSRVVISPSKRVAR